MTEKPAFSAVLTMLVIAHAWESELAAELHPLDLTVRKYALLGHIKACPGISFSELARRSRTTVQSVHVAVKALVAGGFVHDDTAQAGASSTLRVSDAGTKALRHAHRRRDAIDQRIAETMPEFSSGLEGALAVFAAGGSPPRRGAG